jgi:hypothetical protein
MSAVIEIYQLTEAGVALAAPFYKRSLAAQQAQMTFAKSVGGEGFRPESHSGSIATVIFKGAIPKGWRKIREKDGTIEAAPARGTHAGKAIVKQIEQLPLSPQTHELAALFGYAPNSFVIDGTSIYFPTDIRCLLPVERIFLLLPRQQGDGFLADPEMLELIPNWQLEKAVHDHNEARKVGQPA